MKGKSIHIHLDYYRKLHRYHEYTDLSMLTEDHAGCYSTSYWEQCKLKCHGMTISQNIEKVI